MSTKIGRLGSARFGSVERWSKDFTVTEMFGIVFESTFLTAMTIRERVASDCLVGNSARITWTLKLPVGSLASWRAPPPQPAARMRLAQASAIGATRCPFLVKAAASYRRRTPICTSFIVVTTFLGCACLRGAR